MRTAQLHIPVADETDPHGAWEPRDFSAKPRMSFAEKGVRVRCPGGFGVIVAAEGERRYATQQGHVDVALYRASAAGWEAVTEEERRADGRRGRPVHVVRRYDAAAVSALRHATRPGMIAVHDRDVPQVWTR